MRQKNSTSKLRCNYRLYYVFGEPKLSDMPQPKHSYQRNTCCRQLYYTNERKECLLTQTKESGVSSNWHPYYTVHFFICQRFFWKFLKFFHRKRQPDKNQIALFKSLAFIRHIILTLLRVCKSKNHATTCFYINILKNISQIFIDTKRQPNSGCLLVYLFILQIRDVFLLHYSNLSLYLL